MGVGVGLSRLSINARLIAAFSMVVAILIALIAVATVSQGKQSEAQRVSCTPTRSSSRSIS